MRDKALDRKSSAHAKVATGEGVVPAGAILAKNRGLRGAPRVAEAKHTADWEELKANEGAWRRRKFYNPGTSLEVQWLRLQASTARNMCSILGWGTL